MPSKEFGTLWHKILTLAQRVGSLEGGGGGGISALTGDVAASGSGSVAATLANTAVTPGTYGDATNVPQITVDAKGRLTGAVDVAISYAAAITSAVSAAAAAILPIDLTSDVTGVLPVANGGAFLLRSTVTLTDAQIKALPTTGIATLAGPGSGFFNRLFLVSLRSNFSAGAYTNVNAAAWMSVFHGAAEIEMMSYLANDAGITNAIATTTGLTTFLGASSLLATFVPRQNAENINEWGLLSPYHAASNADNGAVVIKIDNAGGGNLTGGHASNTLKITSYYAVEAL